MTQTRLLPIAMLAAATLTLAACGSPHYRDNTSSNYPNPPATVGAPSHYQGTVSRYQGTQSGAAVVNPQDAVINANVINAVTAVPGVRNLQVGTLQGIVTLRGNADSQATAQSAVQAARQVPGVRSVDYDLQLVP
jgi:hyperosmotically inducible protein